MAVAPTAPWGPFTAPGAAVATAWRWRCLLLLLLMVLMLVLEMVLVVFMVVIAPRPTTVCRGEGSTSPPPLPLLLIPWGHRCRRGQGHGQREGGKRADAVIGWRVRHRRRRRSVKLARAGVQGVAVVVGAWYCSCSCGGPFQWAGRGGAGLPGCRRCRHCRDEWGDEAMYASAAVRLEAGRGLDVCDVVLQLSTSASLLALSLCACIEILMNDAWTFHGQFHISRQLAGGERHTRVK